jgi:hypothetical protein
MMIADRTADAGCAVFIDRQLAHTVAVLVVI